MGILDNITNAMGGKSEGSSEEKNIIDSAMDLFKSGGLNNMLKSFENNGLGNIISSWIGKGENLPVSGDQIKKTVDSSFIQDIAKKLGLSEDKASEKIANILPGLVDKVTPDGKIPEGNILQEGIDFLKKKFL